jgi:hypothetical protein
MRNEQDIVVRSERGLETKFETKYHSFSSCVLYFVPLLLRFKKTFVFCTCNDIKNVQFDVEMRKNLKLFGDKGSFVVYSSCNPAAT